MQINITFVIQVVNFCVTYCFLEKILLKPLVALLQKRDALKAKALEDIGKKESDLTALQQQKDADLQAFKVHVNDKYKLQDVKREEIPLISGSDYDDERIHKMVKEGKKLLVERLAHAYKR